MIKIVSVIGARPQFIKAAILSKEISKSTVLQEILVHTGQHYDDAMSDIFFRELNLFSPKYNLGINQGNHAEQTGRMMMALEKIVLLEKPDLVMVYGDTNSTLAGALVGAKLQIPVVHVEAGLRSFDKNMPEEINRVLTDHCSSVFFCPSLVSVENLRKEGIVKKVFNVGDVMYDAILFFSKIALTKSRIIQLLKISPKNYVLLTIHRASNTDTRENLVSILNAFVESGLQVVFPIHPRTRKKMDEYNLWETYQGKNILFIDPVGYIDMISLEKNAKIISTDSGGMQKEAYFLGVPCIILRDRTEWVETISSGHNILVHTDKNKILHALNNPPQSLPTSKLYGEGTASQKIVSFLEKDILRSENH